MVLTEREEELIKLIRALPEQDALKMRDWAAQLVDLAGGREIQWSDSWSDEDLAEVTAASLRRFEKQEGS